MSNFPVSIFHSLRINSHIYPFHLNNVYIFVGVIRRQNCTKYENTEHHITLETGLQARL